MIIPQYQNGIVVYSTFNLLRRLLLYRVLNFQTVLNLRNHFRIKQKCKFNSQCLTYLILHLMCVNPDYRELPEFLH